MRTGDELLPKINGIVDDCHNDQPCITVTFDGSIVVLGDSCFLAVGITILAKVSRTQSGRDHLESASGGWTPAASACGFPCRIGISLPACGSRLKFAEVKQTRLLARVG